MSRWGLGPSGAGPFLRAPGSCLERVAAGGGQGRVSVSAEVLTIKWCLPIDSPDGATYIASVAIQYQTGVGPIPVDDERGESMSYTKSEERALREWWHRVESERDRHSAGPRPADVLRAARWGRESVTRTRGAVVSSFLEGLSDEPWLEWWQCSAGHQLAYSLGRQLFRRMNYANTAYDLERLQTLTREAVAAEQSAIARMLAEV